MSWTLYTYTLEFVSSSLGLRSRGAFSDFESLSVIQLSEIRGAIARSGNLLGISSIPRVELNGIEPSTSGLQSPRSPG
jgi:hypothetical protein